MSVLRQLGRPAMKALASNLDSGSVKPPFQRSQLGGHIPDELVADVLAELWDLANQGMAPSHIAIMLRLLADERAAAQAIADRVELVWSGTDVVHSGSRDTAVVVQELFREARAEILIASYTVDAGGKAEALFGPLGSRMDTEPDLDVRVFVNVHRKHKDTTDESVLLREFAERFSAEVWPGERLPEVYYDPRSLDMEGTKRASLHAKCIIIDEDRALITSANFTEAAHKRNIEAGTVITDTILARALKAQFDTLVDHGALRRVPGL
jgi:phosphatidylserine/phosphatidylglycerophosphate/cardiolipin synthase-like enzyme